MNKKINTLGSEFDRFDATIDALLSVSHDEMQRRLAEQRKQAAKNPNKRGPKPKKPSASSRAAG